MIFETKKDFLAKTSVNRSLLCLDISKNVFGVAYSDTRQTFAFPHSIIERKNFAKDLETIFKTYKEKEAAGIVIGFPLDNLGNKNPSTQRITDIAKDILKYQDIPIVFQDERYSTIAVKNLVNSKNKKNLDNLAATWILQSFLDRVI